MKCSRLAREFFYTALDAGYWFFHACYLLGTILMSNNNKFNHFEALKQRR
jgi:hypothetical protein